MSPRFSAATVSIDDLLGKDQQTLTIPDFQRRFAWDRGDIEDLWEDITLAFVGESDEYFLGPLVLEGDRPRHKRPIIDGQQRLATITMILAAIRNRLAELHSNGVEWAIKSAMKLHELIVRTNMKGDVVSHVLTLGRQDTQSFLRYVQTMPGDLQHLSTDKPINVGSKGRPPRNLIREGMTWVERGLNEYVGAIANDEAVADKLVRLAEYVRYKVSLIAIEVSDDSDAYAVFESLNARGADLSTTDLVKNHLLSISEEHRRIDLAADWEVLMGILEGQSASHFLRAHWLSTRDHLPERQLYAKIKKEIRHISPQSFVAELTESANIYMGLVAPPDSDPLAQTLRDLVAMSSRQGIPFLMAARAVFGENHKEFARALGIVEALLARNIIVGGQNPNQLAGRFSAWAQAVRRKTKTLEDVSEEAKGMLMLDDDFKRAFEELEGIRSPQARYLLRKIEFHTNSETRLASSGVELEHILPQRPPPSWVKSVGLPKEEVEALALHLGNITLLGERLNRKAATRPFSDKRDCFYTKSKITMTSELCKYDTWGTTEIESRQSNLATRAVEIWQL